MRFPVSAIFENQRTFDYCALPPQERDYLHQKTRNIKSLVEKTAEMVWELGKELAEVRDFLRHNKTGGFAGWLKLEFQWQRRTAYNYIAVYETFDNCATIAQLAPSVLYFLAAPLTPKEARQEALERASQGEKITYALAKQIRSHHTIDVEAEVVEDAEEPSNPIIFSSAPTHQSQPEVNELSLTLESTEANRFTIDSDCDSKGQPEQETVTPPFSNYGVGDHVRILRRQHGKDDWHGKSAKIWQITPDGWLRVDVEDHKGVRFTLHPSWVERMLEQPPEFSSPKPEQATPKPWTDKPDPESLMPEQQVQAAPPTNPEKRVRTTLTLFGELVEVEGTITHVQLDWHHKERTGKVQVPVSEVEFLD